VENPRTLTIPGSAAPNLLYSQCQLKEKIKYETLIEMKNKLDPALSGTSRLSIYSTVNQKDN
jgi:hypothetical protein